MLHLIKYNLLVKLKNFATTFWPLIFPILLGTMFYFAFGNIDDADFETVQVGIVKEDGADTLFLMFLDQIENNGNHLIAAQELSESAALTKLENEEISGIYQVEAPFPYSGFQRNPPEHPSVHLSGYETGKSTIRNIVRHTSIRSVGRNPADAKSTGNTLLKFHLADRLLTEVHSFSMH